jgi:predicted RecB family nuclease
MSDSTGTLNVNVHRPNLEEAGTHSTASEFAVPDPPNPSTSPKTLWITDDLLLNYQRCHRRAFLDTYADGSLRDPPSDYLMKLRQDSLSHQLTVLADHPTHQAHYPSRNWRAGANATLELMQQGVEYITRAVLLSEQENGITLVSCPDLLIRQPGQSIFGDWVYAPTEIKLGKRPKLDYQVAATFHAYVLAAVQGTWSEKSWLVLRQRGFYEVDLAAILPKMQDILDECIQTLVSQQEPDVFIAHSRCDLCHWFSHCYQIAQESEHLSLLPGVTPSRYTYLKDLQLTTVESLAEMPPQRLEILPGFGSQVAHKLVLQAQSKLQNRALARPADPNRSYSPPLLSVEELPTAPIELYFDIEAAPEQNLVYLHGVLVVDRQDQTETFHALLADRPEDEIIIWQHFLDLVWRYPTAPIFHFCPYEVQTVKRLAEYYHTPYSQIEPLLGRFVDLHERVTRVVTLPVESYALKPIARWIGFNWRDPESNGAQSIYWYAQWLKTGDRSFLNAILRYNEDDCRATYRVKDWLADFVHHHHVAENAATRQ